MIQSPSAFAPLETIQSDSILGLMSAFTADPAPGKVDLTVGVYRDAEGLTPVMRAVAAAERALFAEQTTKTYLPPSGVAAYLDGVAHLVFGSERAAIADRLVMLQTPGGCGALRVGAELLARSRPAAPILVSDPTWGNHRALLAGGGLSVSSYVYYDRARRRLDLEGMLGALGAAPPGAVVLLQASCHNPTGVDPTSTDWDALFGVMAERGLLPFFDLAYQGLGDDVDRDAYAIRAAARTVPEFLVAVSASKNFGLYRERTGALLVVAADAGRRAPVESHLKQIARALYSMPPGHGGLLAARIFSDADLFRDWQAELRGMAERLRGLRTSFASALATVRPSLDTSWLIRQRGMFSLLGLDAAAVQGLREREHIYMVGDSRINLAGLSSTNIERVAAAIAPLLG